MRRAYRGHQGKDETRGVERRAPATVDIRTEIGSNRLPAEQTARVSGERHSSETSRPPQRTGTADGSGTGVRATGGTRQIVRAAHLLSDVTARIEPTYDPA